jgi:hypothetical protein
MIIIDDFFHRTEFDRFRYLVNMEITERDRRFNELSNGEEKIDLGRENCDFYVLRDEAKTMLIEHLVTRKFLLKSIWSLINKCLLRYHECRYPFRSLWHRDRLTDWYAPEFDVFGFSLYLHDDWVADHGGLYMYKNRHDGSIGNLVEPRKNRLVVNNHDDWHSVTPISDPLACRRSVNFFVPYELQHHDLHRI